MTMLSDKIYLYFRIDFEKSKIFLKSHFFMQSNLIINQYLLLRTSIQIYKKKSLFTRLIGVFMFHIEV